jgi:hypothetical protein
VSEDGDALAAVLALESRAHWTQLLLEHSLACVALHAHLTAHRSRCALTDLLVFHLLGRLTGAALSVAQRAAMPAATPLAERLLQAGVRGYVSLLRDVDEMHLVEMGVESLAGELAQSVRVLAGVGDGACVLRLRDAIGGLEEACFLLVASCEHDEPAGSVMRSLIDLIEAVPSVVLECMAEREKHWTGVLGTFGSHCIFSSLHEDARWVYSQLREYLECRVLTKTSR